MTCAALAFVGPMSVVVPLEHVGIQLVGQPQSGKTSILKVISSIWGWSSTQTHDLGFGISWNTTRNALERTFGAYNQTLAPLDETGNVEGDVRSKAISVLSAVVLCAQGEGKSRFTSDSVDSWYAPLLSTSNVSLVSMLQVARIGSGEHFAYIDRLFDVPPPDEGFGFCEDLHEYCSARAEYRSAPAFLDHLKALAEENHGRAGCHFVTKLAGALNMDRDEIVAFVGHRQDAYNNKAKGISAAGRNLARAHGKFATIYAAGCLAIRFNILPFSKGSC